MSDPEVTLIPDPETQLRRMMDELEDKDLDLSERRLARKNLNIKIVRLARQFPVIAQKLGAPTKLRGEDGEKAAEGEKPAAT